MDDAFPIDNSLRLKTVMGNANQPNGTRRFRFLSENVGYRKRYRNQTDNCANHDPYSPALWGGDQPEWV
jgi:hypothetical protein